ncbi:MAG: hypothetical protein O7H41_02790 [Planctomycetota bacterium]|nr:hypothetical protein [Planctomycetota bacterium]
MRKAILIFVGAVLVIPLLVSAETEKDTQDFRLKYREVNDWTYWSPNPEPVTVGDVEVANLDVPGKGGKIRLEIRRDGFWADSNGDGVVDVKSTNGALTLPLFYEDGSKGLYKILLRKVKGELVYSRFCVMAGKVQGIPVTLIDENHNGIYGEIGTDTMLIGRENAASYVSSVVNIGGKLYNLEISPSGAKVTTTRYEGPSGVLDLNSKYKMKGKVRSHLRLATVKMGEDIFFNLAAKSKKFKIPTGEYDFILGLVGAGKNQMADIEPGRMESFTVKADEVTTYKWGSPGEIEFSALKAEGNITIETSGIALYGQGGERYLRFRPVAFTPRIQVREVKTRKMVVERNMGGGC